MLKFEGVAEVGEIIRAYDFEPLDGRPSCFVEGVVVAKGFIAPGGFKGYTIEVFHDTAYESFPRETVYVPFEMSIMDFDERVRKVEA